MSVSHIILIWQFMASNIFTITMSITPKDISFCICWELKCMRCSCVITLPKEEITLPKEQSSYLVSGFDDYLSWLAL